MEIENNGEILSDEEIENILSGKEISEVNASTEIQDNKDYESVIQDTGSAIVNTQLFVGFLICGVLVSIKIFGGKL